jgi:hypothetical protein
MAALFRQIGWREIDRHAFGGQGEARGVERGANPLARFGDGLVAEADERKADIAVGHLHLHVDRASLKASKATVATRTTIPRPPMRRWRSRKDKHIFGITGIITITKQTLWIDFLKATGPNNLVRYVSRALTDSTHCCVV